ncbi:MAG TPA: ROK family protein [Acidimicrobiia bacterium]|nr:ROK family protein [Acidimicrobiia bacterium]
MSVTIGADIGGSSVDVVARDASATIIARHRVTATMVGASQVVSTAVDAIRALDVKDFDGVGIGIPGRVDRNTGHVSLAVNLGVGAQPFDLAGAVADQLERPVTVENDVRAAVLGERERIGLSGRVSDNLALISIGTGISAGVVASGALIRGAGGMAGEIGHVVVDELGPLCPCGQRGCLEALAAGPAIGRAWPRGESSAAATALFAAVESGDRAARKVASRITGYLTTALVWLSAAYDPEWVVLAGGVPAAGDSFLQLIREEVAARAASSELAARRLGPDQVVLADPSDPPGPRGAALLSADSILQGRDLPADKQANNQ